MTTLIRFTPSLASLLIAGVRGERFLGCIFEELSVAKLTSEARYFA
jgi:hypothetical protein